MNAPSVRPDVFSSSARCDALRPTPLQRAMIADAVSRPNAGFNIEQLIVEMPVPMPMDELRARWQRATARHDALRMAIEWGGAEPVIRVASHAEVPPAERHFESAADFEVWLQEDRKREFDLTHAPLQRVTVARIGDQAPLMVWTVHHLFMDGRSFPLVLRDVFMGAPADEAPRFADYLRHLATCDTDEARRRWREWLAGFKGATTLQVFDETRDPRAIGYDNCSRKLDSREREILAAAAKRLDVSLFTLMQAAWATVLSRYAGSDDVLFGSVMSDRPTLGNHAAVATGNFVHVVPTRIQLDPNQTVRDLLRILRARQIDMRAFPPLDVERYAECAGAALADVTSDTLLLYERRPWDEAIREWGGYWRSAHLRLISRAPVPLSIICLEREYGIELKADFDLARFTEEAASRLLRHFRFALSALARSDAQTRVGEIEIADDAERAAWGAIQGDWHAPPPEPIEETILRSLDTAQDKPAVIEAGALIGRRAFLDRVNAVAHALRAEGVKPGQIIPVLASRSALYYASVLGVLRAGCAFLPLEAERGDARIPAILEDAQCRIGLIAGAPDAPASYPMRWLDVRALPSAPTASPPAAAGPQDAAYVLYTSGSTGTPKGVIITRANLAHYIDAIDAVYQVRPDDRLLQFSSIQFDASIEEIFLSLARGIPLIARPPGPAPDAESLCDFIECTGATILDFPTAYWSEWVRAGAAGTRRFPPAVRLVAVGGEEARADDYRLFRKWAGSAVRWVNTYGPTECTVAVTVYEPTTDEAVEGGVPIGRPLARTSAWVLDHRLRPVPPGAVGELAIGGAGVGRGYLNRPDETRNRFVANPHRPSPDPVLYLTGDRVWRRRDGALVFVGRADAQVKIRGFRVEPGEAAAVLRAHPAVRDAVVLALARGAAARELAAFWAPADPASGVDEHELRAFVAARLPDYLTPTDWHRVERIPLTPNGKIDMAALRRHAQLCEAERTRTPPRGDAEETVARIWREFFGVERIGREDSFFALGGHSLLAMRLLSELRQSGWVLDPADLFRDGSLPAVARALVRLDQAPSAAQRNRSVRKIYEGRADRTPLVLAPSDFGDLLVYANLIEHLNHDRPTWGLECAWLIDEQNAIDSIQRLAAALVDDLIAADIGNRVAFIGYCFGGYIAMELVREWRARKREVVWLGLMDARPFSRIDSSHYYWTQINAVLRARPSDWLRFVQTRAARWRSARRRARLMKRESPALSPREQVQWRMYHVIARDYKSPRFEGELDFFYPRESRFDLYDDPTGGWLDWADRVRVHQTPGSHTDMLKSPHAGILAARVEASIRSAERRMKEPSP